jgi:stress response protein YsnF
VPINAFVEGAAPQVREEDGIVIIPVLEEILVVEKRLYLREEVRLVKRVTEATSPHTVSLRREVVEIERIAPDGLEMGGAQAQDLRPQSEQDASI